MMKRHRKSFAFSETVVVLACVALTVFVLAFIVPKLIGFFNIESARNDAKVVCQNCITEDLQDSYSDIIITVKTAGRYYLFSYDISKKELYEYSGNPIETESDETSLEGILEDFCESENNNRITDISSKMSRLPMNVSCFIGAKLKGVIKLDENMSGN